MGDATDVPERDVGGTMHRQPRSLIHLALAVATGAALVIATPVAVPAQAGARIATTTTAIPQAAHVVLVMMENKSFHRIDGNPAAPYINSLGRTGALFTQSYAIQHPSI